ncbi:hypothetical protein JTB14_035505 [Gonioctena quinquepunctata]|nr:hypothetical protein JTB14_035505 [Gonioctena quinquepunctata]
MQGGVISWNSRKQPTIELLTTEADYMSLTAAVQEGLWLKGLECGLIRNTGQCIIINGDNKSSLQLALTTAYYARTKHIQFALGFTSKLVLGVLE